uniref:Lengsin n=1 Tax=Myotis myotis TaxID=51298 RepID=A0A7J7WVD5_MYOMY|nr:lengsin, lens protein with glutamine synthetase domain [Myotis myotis]
MNNEGDLLQEDSRDECNVTEGSRMSKLRRTRKKVTKSHISSTEIGEMDMSISKDDTGDSTQILKVPQLSSRMKHIKKEMAKNHLQFVRFEATDLHGVSRSKSIPAHFFQEKVTHGVFMPRGYLELMPSPQGHEVDHIRATCFNSDIVLMPELSTFRALPWAERTARVICDTFTVTGEPLLTSPRYIAKRQLRQLQGAGFSLLSAFLYDFCVFGAPEVINSKTISFPAATLFNNQHQPFIQELVDGLCRTGAHVESFSSSTRPGQVEICLRPEFGIGSADNAFTLRAGVREVARKYNYITSFFIETGFCHSGILSHSLWDVGGENNLFCSSPGPGPLSATGRRWVAGLLKHAAALSCLLAPARSCRKRYSKESKEQQEGVPTTWGYNDNSCAFNVKCHGEKGARVENTLGSATANPYLVLAATVAAGLDGLQSREGALPGPEDDDSPELYPSKPPEIPLKLEDALVALEEDPCLRQALGETFIRYFVAMKKYELENEDTDAERNKFLEYFI